MGTHIVIDGNAFYEIDDDCMKEKERMRQREIERQMPAEEDIRFVEDQENIQE